MEGFCRFYCCWILTACTRQEHVSTSNSSFTSNKLPKRGTIAGRHVEPRTRRKLSDSYPTADVYDASAETAYMQPGIVLIHSAKDSHHWLVVYTLEACQHPQGILA
jgi:hypothetical protein